MRNEAVMVMSLIMPFCSVAPCMIMPFCSVTPCMIHMHQHAQDSAAPIFGLEAAGSSSALLCIY